MHFVLCILYFRVVNRLGFPIQTYSSKTPDDIQHRFLTPFIRVKALKFCTLWVSAQLRSCSAFFFVHQISGVPGFSGMLLCLGHLGPQITDERKKNRKNKLDGSCA